MIPSLLPSVLCHIDITILSPPLPPLLPLREWSPMLKNRNLPLLPPPLPGCWVRVARAVVPPASLTWTLSKVVHVSLLGACGVPICVWWFVVFLTQECNHHLLWNCRTMSCVVLSVCSPCCSPIPSALLQQIYIHFTSFLYHCILDWENPSLSMY